MFSDVDLPDLGGGGIDFGADGVSDKKTDKENKEQQKLYSCVCHSKDKLFFMAHKPPGATVPLWYLVQVDAEETQEDKACNRGMYRVRWWVELYDTKSRPLSQCWFWPDIRVLRSNHTLGAHKAVPPDKVEAWLERCKDLAWYQLDVNLYASAIVGPFNFVQIHMQLGKENYRVAYKYWEILLAKGPTKGVDITNVNQQPRCRKKIGRTRPCLIDGCTHCQNRGRLWFLHADTQMPVAAEDYMGKLKTTGLEEEESNESDMSNKCKSGKGTIVTPLPPKKKSFPDVIKHVNGDDVPKDC